MSQTQLTVLFTAAPWALLVAGIMITVGIDPYINRRNQRLILLINGLVLLLMAAEVTEYVISKGQPNDMLRTCASAFGYAVRPALLVLFLYVLFPQRCRWPLWAAAGVNVAIYFTSIFTDVAFFIADNRFHRGPLNRACLVISAALMLYMTALLIQTSRRSGKKEIVLIMFSTALIALGILMDAIMARLHIISFLTMAIIGSMVFYYLWLHMQLARMHEEKLIENLQTEHRIQLMISQIQPHFLFNTLSSIQALCETEPYKAAELTERFGQYLRENLDSLNQPKLVPFIKELEHTRTYAEIEQVRFPSIKFIYDLRDVDFEVPALTIQPLVENAIRHGVRLRVNGEIQISSRRGDGWHTVTIRDNGKGFDADKAFVLEGTHIGLRNVRERVEQMCGGVMEIRSGLGEGATITLRFPAGEERT